MIAGAPRDKFIKMCEKLSPFCREVLGIKVMDVSHGKISLMIPFKNDFVGNPLSKVLHGGVTAALLDHAGGFAAWSSLKEADKFVSTVDLNVSYLRPAPGEDLICEAFVVHSTKRLIRSDMTVWTKDRVRVAIGRGTYNVYKGNLENASQADLKQIAEILH